MSSESEVSDCRSVHLETREIELLEQQLENHEAILESKKDKPTAQRSRLFCCLMAIDSCLDTCIDHILVSMQLTLIMGKLLCHYSFLVLWITVNTVDFSTGRASYYLTCYCFLA